MKNAEIEADPVRINATSIEVYLSSVELAELLKLSDSEVAKLARSGVLARRPDPYDRRSFIYPAWRNIKAYLEHVRGRKEKAGLLFLQEKSRTQRVIRQRTELEMAIKKGKLVSASRRRSQPSLNRYQPR
jgi:hypothetical protein